MLFERPRPWIISILLALVAVTGGCSSPASKRTLPQVPPLSRPAPLPVSRNISVTAEQLAGADPCDLVDQNALSMLGTAKLALNNEVRSCDATFTGPDIGSVSVSVEFHPQPGSSEKAVRHYRGITIYGDQPSDNGSCARSVTAATDAVLTIASDYSAGKKWSACRIADRAVEAAVSRLLRGGLRPAGYPTDSLARQDACRLIAQQEANRIPGINRLLHDSGYRGQYCQWGEGPVDKPGLYLAFELSGPLQAGNGWRPITVAKRHAFIQSFTTDQNQLASCEIQLINRSSFRPSFLGDYEMIDIVIHANQSAHENCSLVTDLATKALTRMAQST
jgi:hypothetical protein